MKRTRFYLAILAVISVLFFSCRPEQSELEMSDLNDTTTISGSLVYDAGVDTAGSPDQYAVHQIRPVANRAIFIEIPYSEFNFNTGQKGTKIYTTETDENGSFRINVPTTPVGLKGVTVRMQEFTAYKSEYKKMEGSVPVFETDLYRYTWVKTGLTLKPGSIEFFKEDDRNCAYDKVQLDELKETITLVGNIQLAQETGFRKGIYKKASNATVEFEATYPEGYTGVLTAGTVTDASGNYKITLPLKSYKDGFKTLAVKVLGLSTPYVHYSTLTDHQDLSGAYKDENVLVSSPITNIIEGMEYNMKTMYLRFSPGYNNNLSTGAAPTSYTQSLAGWEKYDGFTETTTVTGKYLLAQSESFGRGTFANPYGEARFAVTYGDVTRGISTKVIYAPAAADGTFSFELPVADASEVLDVQVLPLNQAVAADPSDLAKRNFKYSHVTSDNSKVVFDGQFVNWANASAKPVRELGAEWNNLGTSYFTFTPDSKISKSDLDKASWNKDLSGWAIDPDNKESVTITAKVYFPVETAFGIGSYVPADGRVLAVNLKNISDEDLGNFAAPVIGGEFKVVVPVKNKNDELKVALNNDFKLTEVYDFLHYTGNEQVKLNGKFEKREWIGEDVADRKAWNDLGSFYYKFVPDITAEQKTTLRWNENLSDWIKDADNLYTKEVSANVYFAAESSFGKAKYNKADNYLLQIKVGTNTYAAPVHNGLFKANILVRDIYQEPLITWETSDIDKVKDFVHYYDGNNAGKTRNLVGKYTKKDWIGEDKADRTEWTKLGDVYYKFVPDYTADELKSMYWFEDLAGWYVNKELKVEKTVTGSLFKAYETAFYAGSYEPLKFVEVKAVVNGNTFVGVTDVDGNYEIPVRLKYDEEPTIAITVPYVGEKQKFNHYRRPGKTDVDVIEVNYGSEFTNFEKGIDDWNNRKATYYKVTGCVGTTPDYWSLKLAGWENKVYNVRDRMTKTLTVNGGVKRAVEKKEGSDWAAKWENDPYRLLTVTISDGGSLTRSYDLAANGSGTFSLPFVLDEIKTDYNVTIECHQDLYDKAGTVKFIHYKDVDKDNRKVIVGKFSSAGNISATNFSVNGTSIKVTPTAKMVFTPNSTVEGWGNYSWTDFSAE